jgi:hypothetical protein
VLGAAAAKPVIRPQGIAKTGPFLRMCGGAPIAPVSGAFGFGVQALETNADRQPGQRTIVAGALRAFSSGGQVVPPDAPRLFVEGA